MEYQNLQELQQSFLSGQFDFPDEFKLMGIKYKYKKTSEYSLESMLKKSYKAFWLYSTAYREQAIEQGINQILAFVWGFQEGYLAMKAFDVRTTSIPRIAIPMTEADNGNSVNIPKEKIVGDVVDVVITSIPNSNTMKGKIDTGADVSSIHAEEWNIDNGQVTFVCPELSENRISLPVIEKQAIRSSNGDTEYRPVIELNIKINEQQLTNVMFNLNDRGKMSYPMLVGQNILEVGGFMIDPTINDPDAPVDEGFEIDWDAVNEEFSEVEQFQLPGSTNKKINEILQVINKWK